MYRIFYIEFLFETICIEYSISNFSPIIYCISNFEIRKSWNREKVKTERQVGRDTNRQIKLLQLVSQKKRKWAKFKWEIERERGSRVRILLQWLVKWKHKKKNTKTKTWLLFDCMSNFRSRVKYFKLKN
jgi:hypothetical protein